jgi:hypothetical protein
MNPGTNRSAPPYPKERVVGHPAADLARGVHLTADVPGWAPTPAAIRSPPQATLTPVQAVPGPCPRRFSPAEILPDTENDCRVARSPDVMLRPEAAAESSQPGGGESDQVAAGQAEGGFAAGTAAGGSANDRAASGAVTTGRATTGRATTGSATTGRATTGEGNCRVTALELDQDRGWACRAPTGDRTGPDAADALATAGRSELGRNSGCTAPCGDAPSAAARPSAGRGSFPVRFRAPRLAIYPLRVLLRPESRPPEPPAARPEPAARPDGLGRGATTSRSRTISTTVVGGSITPTPH